MIFLDTSALVKRYVAEPGSDTVRRCMDDDFDWAASALARTEAKVTLCHRGSEGRLASPPQRQLDLDWDRFAVIPIDAECLSLAVMLGCQHRIQTLDAIHLAAALRLPEPVAFLSFDRHQSDVARVLGLEVVPV
ncbi:MAG TPA: type II toxin-antitoxin system VapC family toxin [Candidatus Limnocylindrales bacterium]|nr:type II toxin-antitoxin system VapC family toxin [Candidatus Limnocylindrales bacterium]